jgi:hypothetical protein
MFTSHELHDGLSPTINAYDGSWLELLENPDASLPYREATGSSGGPSADAAGPTATGRGQAG